jgi:hypothetical protein
MKHQQSEAFFAMGHLHLHPVYRRQLKFQQQVCTREVLPPEKWPNDFEQGRFSLLSFGLLSRDLRERIVPLDYVHKKRAY